MTNLIFYQSDMGVLNVSHVALLCGMMLDRLIIRIWTGLISLFMRRPTGTNLP